MVSLYDYEKLARLTKIDSNIYSKEGEIYGRVSQ